MSGLFRLLTAGDSHGEALVAVIDGIPAGLPLTEGHINEDLARRQRGYGRGGRMKIEHDQIYILSGDVCAVPAAGIEGEAMTAIVRAGAYLASLKTW
jgi:chorismate synthase